MFRKLTSLLFKEEEVVFEQDLGSQEHDDLDIPELKPMTAPKRTVIREEIIEEPVIETPRTQEVVVEETRRKTVRIDADAPLEEVKEIKLKKEVTARVQAAQYQPKEIISPMFGGSNKATAARTEVKQASDAKKRTAKTTVISPMFGAISTYDEPKEETIVDMDLDITDMLSPDRVEEDVQVSLYDFLEDFKDE